MKTITCDKCDIKVEDATDNQKYCKICARKIQIQQIAKWRIMKYNTDPEFRKKDLKRILTIQYIPKYMAFLDIFLPPYFYKLKSNIINEYKTIRKNAIDKEINITPRLQHTTGAIIRHITNLQYRKIAKELKIPSKHIRKTYMKFEKHGLFNKHKFDEGYK